MEIHTHTHRHRHTDIHTDIYRHMEIHTHRHMKIYMQKYTETHRHTHRHVETHTDTHRHRYTDIWKHSPPHVPLRSPVAPPLLTELPRVSWPGCPRPPCFAHFPRSFPGLPPSLLPVFPQTLVFIESCSVAADEKAERLALPSPFLLPFFQGTGAI